MAAIGSDEWLTLLVGAAVPVDAEVTGKVSVTIERSPSGKVGWTELYDSGVLVATTAPAEKGADIALIAKFDEFVAMLEGASDPAVLFMQGRLKLTGDMGMFMKMLPGLLTDDAAAGRAELASATDA